MRSWGAGTKSIAIAGSAPPPQRAVASAVKSASRPSVRKLWPSDAHSAAVGYGPA